MNRRVFLACALTSAAIPFAAIARDIPPLRAAFETLAPSARRSVQDELAIAGFYEGAIDGRYGPRTERGLIAAAAHLSENSGGRVRVDVTSARGSRAYVADLAAGRHAKWLYGEGDECDPPGSCGD